MKVFYEYNLVKLFGALPMDMIREILEFDDTYHNTFRTEIFREQLVHQFWKQSFIEEAIRDLVYSQMEYYVKHRQTFIRPSNIYIIMAGRLETKSTYHAIKDIRKEIKIILSPFQHFMRWKMIPVQDKSTHYENPLTIYDGCIGDNINIANPTTFLSVFFGAGRIGGQTVKNLTPTSFSHIGDTFWF